MDAAISSTASLALLSLIGVGATGGSFYATYHAPDRNRLAALALLSALLVGVSPFLTLWLGANSQLWLRKLMISSLAPFSGGLLLFATTLALSRRWVVTVSVLPMTALAFWSFLLLSFFATGL